jgi:hypothetical protein
MYSVQLPRPVHGWRLGQNPEKPEGARDRSPTPSPSNRTGRDSSQPPVAPALLWWGGILLAIVFSSILNVFLLPAAPPRVVVSYTFFRQQVAADNVVKVSTHADTIEGTFRQAIAYPPDAGDKRLSQVASAI